MNMSCSQPSVDESKNKNTHVHLHNPNGKYRKEREIEKKRPQNFQRIKNKETISDVCPTEHFRAEIQSSRLSKIIVKFPCTRKKKMQKKLLPIHLYVHLLMHGHTVVI